MLPRIVEIKVNGPGQCIYNEMLIIEKALKDAGYYVEVIDDYPPPENQKIESVIGYNIKVILKANHQPWGG